MRPLPLTACDSMVHKGYKFSLKLVVPIRKINFRVQHLTCSPIVYVRSKQVSLPYHPLTFGRTLFLLMTCYFQSSTKHVNTGGAICTNNNFLVLCDGVFDDFFKFFFCFHTVSTGYIQLFCFF